MTSQLRSSIQPLRQDREAGGRIPTYLRLSSPAWLAIGRLARERNITSSRLMAEIIEDHIGKFPQETSGEGP